MYVYIYIYTCIYVYIYTYKHTHMKSLSPRAALFRAPPGGGLGRGPQG